MKLKYVRPQRLSNEKAWKQVPIKIQPERPLRVHPDMKKTLTLQVELKRKPLDRQGKAVEIVQLPQSILELERNDQSGCLEGDLLLELKEGFRKRSVHGRRDRDQESGLAQGDALG